MAVLKEKKFSKNVIPAKAGIQKTTSILDSRFHGNDILLKLLTFSSTSYQK